MEFTFSNFTSLPFQVVLPIQKFTSLNINWGDGTINSNPSHTFQTQPTKPVIIVSGNFTQFGYSDASSGWEGAQYLTSVDITNISNILNLVSLKGSFFGANKLINITGSPSPSITNMENMFDGCSAFNQDLSSWDVSNVTNMDAMFRGCTAFNQKLSWDVSSVTSMAYMFLGCTAFNKNLSSWGDKLTSVREMLNMFGGCTSFNQDLSSWDVSNVIGMQGMFNDCTAFDQNLSSWNVSQVIYMENMFNGCTSFNQDLSSWGLKVSNVITMAGMFGGCTFFNQDLSSWNVSSVTNMPGMFNGCTSFNQNLSSWDVSKVTNMFSMFYGCDIFNQDLSSWDVSHVTNMGSMFAECTSFNQNLSLDAWDVSNVTIMQSMFRGCTSFNQNLSSWNISNLSVIGDMFIGSGIDTNNFSSTLAGWIRNSPTIIPDVLINNTGISLNAEGYAAYLILIGKPNYWIFSVTPPQPCFLKKTRILTSTGFVSVENLKVGDEIFTKGSITKNGSVRFEDIDYNVAKIKWLGHFTSSCKPICFLKGSLQKNIPIKDLYVSPDHQFLVNRQMVQAKQLINNSTIFEVDINANKNEYYHVELDTHSVIIAEGALTESYLDLDNRFCFTHTDSSSRNAKKSTKKMVFRR